MKKKKKKKSKKNIEEEEEEEDNSFIPEKSKTNQSLNNNDKALIPIGNPNTTSLIIPDKNINPYPKL